MKDLLERKNYEELTDVIVHNSEETRQKKITMNMIKKRNFCKYYFCCLWICMDRDYLDYENVLVKNRDEFFDVEQFVKKKTREPKMKIIARNIHNIKKELRTHSPPPQAHRYYENSSTSKEMKKKELEMAAMMKKHADLIRITQGKRKTDIHRNSFNAIIKTSENNAWLDIQKLKGTCNRINQKCDFSTIRDSSRNGVFKKNSDSSSDTNSSQNSDNDSDTNSNNTIIEDTSGNNIQLLIDNN
jgi:hypothetical protein